MSLPDDTISKVIVPPPEYAKKVSPGKVEDGAKIKPPLVGSKLTNKLSLP